ncbi:MAG: universal stress protein [Pseudomonadota bacterium]
MNRVYACVDGSRTTEAVCSAAAWAAQRLGAPVTLLHVLDRFEYPQAPADFSGNIGLGSREQLLEELAELDRRRGQLAREQGRLLLEACRERTQGAGAREVEPLQRHGELVDTLAELAGDIRLLILGQHGEDGDRLSRQVGTHLENAVRTLHRPTLITLEQFTAPERVLLAYDGSPTSRKAVERLAESPLLRALPIDLLTVGADTAVARAALDEAEARLARAGFETRSTLRAGEVVPVIDAYTRENGIGLLVMGAWGHSRIRQFLLGSTTTRLIQEARLPILLLH